MSLPPILTSDGRKAWAFMAILGGCIIMTGFAAYGVYLVQASAGLSFWLAMAAHAQVALGLSGLIALFVRRSVKIGKDGVEFHDKSSDDS